MNDAVQLPAGVEHGTNYAYGKFKCRCQPCRANRSQSRRRWASEATRPVSALVAFRDEGYWPLQPLIDRYPRGSLQDRLGVSNADWQRASTRGLTDATADRWALKLGLHPVAVWGWEWIERGLTELDRVFLYGTATAEPGWRRAAEYDHAPTERQEVAA